MKKNFAIDTRVKFVNLPECELLGKTGVILGTANINVTDFYIVQLDEPVPSHRAVVMTESCLESI